jgi:hypothetical protein
VLFAEPRAGVSQRIRPGVRTRRDARRGRSQDSLSRTGGKGRRKRVEAKKSTVHGQIRMVGLATTPYALLRSSCCFSSRYYAVEWIRRA